MIRNVHNCQKVQVAHMEDKMRECCLRWIGHVIGSLPDELFLRRENKMIKGVIRGRVRLEITWKGVVLKN